MTVDGSKAKIGTEKYLFYQVNGWTHDYSL